jgi:hypothetical protein
MSNPVHGQWGRMPNGHLIHTRYLPRILGFDATKSSLTNVSKYNSPKVQLPVLRSEGGGDPQTMGVYSAEHSQYFGGQLRVSSLYCIENNILQIKGETSIAVQVGWWFEGRKRYDANVQAFVDYDSYQNKIVWDDGGEIQSHDANGNLVSGGYTVLSNGRICNLQAASAQLKDFWIVTQKPNSNTRPEGLALKSSGWSAVSNGNGTVRWEKV